MDADGYPTEEELLKVTNWPIRNAGDMHALMAFVQSIWNWPDWGWIRDGSKYELHTGGWSGNEDVAQALKENHLFWSMCWMSSRRGGHHQFEVPQF